MTMKAREYHELLLEGPEEVLEYAFDPEMAPVLYEKGRGPQRWDEGTQPGEIHLGTGPIPPGWKGGEVLDLSEARRSRLEPHKRDEAELVAPEGVPFDEGRLAGLIELPTGLAREARIAAQHERITAQAGLSNLNRALNWYWPLIDDMPYGWWTSGDVPPYAPAYAINEACPAMGWLLGQEGFCASVPTLNLRAVGKRVPTYGNLRFDGGTYAYAIYYRDYIQPFRLADVRPGDLIGRYYRDVRDQGHVAIVLDGYLCLQSFDGGAQLEGYFNGPGVNRIYTVAQSHAGGYYEWRVRREDWINYAGDLGGFRAAA